MPRNKESGHKAQARGTSSGYQADGISYAKWSTWTHVQKQSWKSRRECSAGIKQFRLLIIFSVLRQPSKEHVRTFNPSSEFMRQVTREDAGAGDAFNDLCFRHEVDSVTGGPLRSLPSTVSLFLPRGQPSSERRNCRYPWRL